MMMFPHGATYSIRAKPHFRKIPNQQEAARDCRQHTQKGGSAASARAWPRVFSFIRTVTVGSGLAPDLLTSPHEERSRAPRHAGIPPVGTFTPP